jgi:hypothetical protein
MRHAPTHLKPVHSVAKPIQGHGQMGKMQQESTQWSHLRRKVKQDQGNRNIEYFK